MRTAGGRNSPFRLGPWVPICPVQHGASSQTSQPDALAALRATLLPHGAGVGGTTATLCPGHHQLGSPALTAPSLQRRWRGSPGHRLAFTPPHSSALALLLTAFRAPALHLLITCSRKAVFPQTAFFKVYCLQGPAISTSCPFPSPLSPGLPVTPLPPHHQTMGRLSASALLTLVPLLGRCSVNKKFKEIAIDATEKIFMLTEALTMKPQEP